MRVIPQNVLPYLTSYTSTLSAKGHLKCQRSCQYEYWALLI